MKEHNNPTLDGQISFLNQSNCVDAIQITIEYPSSMAAIFEEYLGCTKSRHKVNPVYVSFDILAG
jgi:hypothetical protein